MPFYEIKPDETIEWSGGGRKEGENRQGKEKGRRSSYSVDGLIDTSLR